MNGDKSKSSKLMRSLVPGGLFFGVFVCCCFLVAGYHFYNTGIVTHYRSMLGDILGYCAGRLDAGSIGRESNGGTESLLDDMEAGQLLAHSGLDRMYILMPKPGSAGYKEVTVPEFLSDMDGETKEAFQKRLLTEDDSPELMARYVSVMAGESGPVYFRSSDGWELTGMIGLRDRPGAVVCVLAADMSLETVRKELVYYMLSGILASAILLLIYAALTYAWLKKRLIRPLMAVEKSVVEYAEHSRAQETLTRLVYNRPEIDTRDEIQALADAMASLSEDMNDYVERLSLSRSEMRIMKRHVDKMDEIAYKDTLTGVNNKASYERIKSRLDWDIMNGRARFAIVMIDLNFLKKVNDRLGHEAGDEYICSAGRILENAFENSPIFRVGGDEFVVVLENKDYNDREQLIERLNSEIERTSADTSIPESQRVSAAVGIAVYNQSGDEDAESVLRRADNMMYENKKSMKALRED